MAIRWLDFAVRNPAAVDAVASNVVPINESIGLPGYDYDDPDLNLPGNQAAGNWRRITQSASDLTPLTQERMQQLALYLSDKNPVARGILDLIVSFIVGEGFTVTSKDDDVQETIDRFWDDAQNDMDSRTEDMTRELSIFGEQVALAFVNEKSGRVALVAVDPRQIRAVMPHPTATDRPFAVGLADTTATESVYRWIKIIDEDDDPSSDTFGRMVGAQPGETFRRGDRVIPFYQPPAKDGAEAGSTLAGCFLWAINKPRSAMRGRSDLLAVADNVDMLDQFLFDEGQRMSFQRVFAWVCKVTGASAGDLAAKAAASPAPKPGGVLYTNESEEWSVMAPDLNTQDSQNYADLQISTIATATGLPKTWLNGIMDVNRATAQSMDAPSLKRLTRRQKYVRRMLERMVRFVLDQAELAGTLNAAGDGRHEFTVSTPEMSSRDLEVAGRSLMSVAQAMGMASAAGWIDDQTAQQAVALMMSQLGVDIDLAEVKERLEQQAKDRAEQDDGPIPDYFGLGAGPGPDSLAKAMGAGGAQAQGGDGQQQVATVSQAAKDLATVFKTLSDAMVELGGAGVLDSTTAQEVIAKVLEPLGLGITAEMIQQRLDQEAADQAEEQAPAPGGPVVSDAAGSSGAGPAASLLPDGADVINLDQLALEAVALEAFSPDLHPRGAGGKFAEKPGATNLANTPDAKAMPDSGASTTASTSSGQQSKPGTTTQRKTSATPSMKQSDLKNAIATMNPGDAVSIRLTNDIVVSGTVTTMATGAAVIQTGDGKYTILHAGLKGVADVVTPSGTVSPSPTTPRKTGAGTKPPADRSAAAKKAAATRAANRAAAASAPKA